MDEQMNIPNTDEEEELGKQPDNGRTKGTEKRYHTFPDQAAPDSCEADTVLTDPDGPESSDKDDNSEFQKVDMTEEHEEADAMESDSNDHDGMPEETIELQADAPTKNVEFEENIDFPDMETEELQDEADVSTVEEAKNESMDILLPSGSMSVPASIPQSSSETCLLRHRIDPEPPRQSQDEDDDFVRLSQEDITPKGSKEKRKISLIRKALEADPVDIAALRNLAISPGGLVNKNMRQRVWPLLINANTNNITPKPSQEEMQSLTQTYAQVVMDVNRSSSRFPPGIDDHVRMSMKDKLVDLIMRVMLKHRQLKYYQGFHDVCITFLLCMDEDLAFAMVDKLAMGYMREYLDDTMERTSLLLNYIYPLVNKCNPELCEHMERNDLGTIFALSWVITWFSHVLGDIRRILRVFDFFLASHRMMPVYLSAAFVLFREQDIYAAGDEMGYIHKCLSTIPPDLPLEELLERAGDLYLQYPPTEISCDPMLIRMNRQVFEHFNRIDSRNASRRLAAQSSDVRSSMFVKATMWTVTAVVGVAAAVLYNSYMGSDWTLVDMWSPFT